MPVVVIGLNHRTAPLEVLEAMTVGDDALGKTTHALLSRDNVSEAVVLSTCNRTEVYAIAERFHGGYAEIRSVLAELAFLDPDDFTDHLFVHHDNEAVAHLFDVVSGLDSAVLGEHEIQGQVKQAWEAAQDLDAVGPNLNLLFRHALEAGKRVRTDTGIGQGTASVSYSAVALAAQTFGRARAARAGTPGDEGATGAESTGDLRSSVSSRRSRIAGSRAVVLGTGAMGKSMAASLVEADVGDLCVANRTYDSAVELADPIPQGRAIRFADVADELVTADVLFTSTGAASVLLTRDDVADIMGRRDGRPLLILDIAVPRDIDPSVAELDGVTVLDMDDLTAFADAGLAERRAEVDAARDVLRDELDRFRAATSAQAMAPAITALRTAAETTRAAEFDRACKSLAGLDADQLAAVDAFSQALVSKLLHTPTVALRDAAGTAKGDRLIQALRDLFDIDGE